MHLAWKGSAIVFDGTPGARLFRRGRAVGKAGLVAGVHRWLMDGMGRVYRILGGKPYSVEYTLLTMVGGLR